MTTWILAVAGGLACLVWASDRFVHGASALSRNVGVSPLVIGLTVVGMGTSAPEMVLSAVAALDGSRGIAVGNAIGSNIANVGLVLGVTALVAPVAVASNTLRRQFPLMFAVMGLAWVLLRDGVLGRGDGLVLLGACAGILVAMVVIARRAHGGDTLHGELQGAIPVSVATARAIGWTLLGLLLLLASSRAVVWGALGIARHLEVSDLVIGLTVVAIGTSLPELAACVTSIVKREPGIALGNVIGSNIFNLMPVLAMPALIAPGPVPPLSQVRDYPVMIVMSLVLYVMAFGFHGKGRINRWEGAVLLAAFVAYQALLVPA